MPQPTPTPGPEVPTVNDFKVLFDDDTEATSVTLAPGKSIQLKAVAYDSAGAVMKAPGNFAWSSSANSYATVTQTGKTTAKKWRGTVYVQVTLATPTGLLSRRVQVNIQ